MIKILKISFVKRMKISKIREFSVSLYILETIQIFHQNPKTPHKVYIRNTFLYHTRPPSPPRSPQIIIITKYNPTI